MSNDPTQWSPFHDKHGRPICAGDLLKTLHFIGARRKRYWLYHVAVYSEGHWWMVPTCWLDPSKVSGGGRCLLVEDRTRVAEIIDGYGPGDYLSYEDRPRMEAKS